MTTIGTIDWRRKLVRKLRENCQSRKDECREGIESLDSYIGNFWARVQCVDFDRYKNNKYHRSADFTELERLHCHTAWLRLCFAFEPSSWDCMDAEPTICRPQCLGHLMLGAVCGDGSCKTLKSILWSLPCRQHSIDCVGDSYMRRLHGEPPFGWNSTYPKTHKISTLSSVSCVWVRARSTDQDQFVSASRRLRLNMTLVYFDAKVVP